MKNLILLVCVILFLASCKEVKPPADTAQKVKDSLNIALVKDLFKAVENEDIEAVKVFYSDTVAIVGPNFNEWIGYNEMVENLSEWFKAGDSIKVDIFAIMAQTVKEENLAGDWVFLWSDLSYWDLGAGKKVKIMYHAAEKIQDNKIVIEGNYWNQWDAFKQLGAELKWPDKKK